ncbi:MAG TPA: hypothetical protein VG126_14680 [Thermoleophilaceae bacterium]|nr:hypothetical protein [Thermoleophilaceae bacterium]
MSGEDTDAMLISQGSAPRTMRDTGNPVSQENVELVRRFYAELASEGSPQEFEQPMSDDALGRFFDPEIEWVPVTESLLAADADGARQAAGLPA